MRYAIYSHKPATIPQEAEQKLVQIGVMLRENTPESVANEAVDPFYERAGVVDFACRRETGR